MAAKAQLAATFYPYSAHLLEDVLKPMSGEHGGIAQSLIMSPIRYSDDLDIRSVMFQMPGYHRVLLNPDLDMQYHLSGYGMFYEEALIRLVGEAIERYALLVAPHTMAEQIQYASYEQMAQRGRIVPFEYLRLFSDADYEKLNHGQFHGMRALEKSDVVGWVNCPSLFDPKSEIAVPAQMLFVGYKFSRQSGEVGFCPGFSTGTAAHTSVAKALQNALLEFIEIDALMLHWYTSLKAPLVSMDNLSIASLVPKLFGGDSAYDVMALDLRVLKGVDAHVFGAAIMNRREERPLITFGAQGHLDPKRAFYRGLMESLAISFLGIYGPLYLPREYLAPAASSDGFTDLDRNVSFYASPDEAELKRGLIKNMTGGSPTSLSAMKSYDSGDASADTARLIQQLSTVSEFGVFLDVTPPETQSRGWKVMRVFLPELVTMCLPGVPYSQHPRFKQYGGIQNEYPHPLP